MQAIPVLPHQSRQTMSSWMSSVCAQGNCHAGEDLGPEAPVKGSFNSTAYKYLIYNCGFEPVVLGE